MSEIQSDSRLREGSESVGPDGEQSKKKLVERWHKRKSHRKSHKKIKEGRKRAKRRNKEQQR